MMGRVGRVKNMRKHGATNSAHSYRYLSITFLKPMRRFSIVKPSFDLRLWIAIQALLISHTIPENFDFRL